MLFAFLAGILAGSEFSGHKTIASGAGWLSAGVGLFLFLLYKQPPRIPLLLIMAALGYLGIDTWITPGFSPDHIIHYADQYNPRITGRIHSGPVPYARDGIRFVLEVNSLGTDAVPVSGLLRVSARGDLPELSAGDRIAFAGKIRGIRNLNNPGGFDYERYMAFQGLWVSAYVRKDSLMVVQKSRSPSWMESIQEKRTELAGVIEKTAVSEVSAGVLKALVIGDKSAVSDDLRERFSRAGISHLLAISGLHIGIVAGLFFGMFKWLLCWWRPLLWNGWLHPAAAGLTLAPVLAYGFISGMSPATQRALVMVVVFLATFWVRKEPDVLNTIALAALVILMVHPPALFSISFQLSFAAVIAIVWGLSRVARPVPGEFTRYGLWKLRVKNFLWVSFWAIIGTLPLTMFYFNQVSFIGLAANPVFIPLIGFVTVPLGLSGVFLYLIHPAVGEWFFQAAHLTAGFSLKLVPFFADLPFGAMRTITPTVLEIGCYYLLVWSVVNLLVGSDPVKNKNRIWTPKRVLICALVILSADIGYWVYQRFGRGDLRVTVMDVGQGSAVLAELPGGRCMLIDGGGFYDNSVFDVGARIVAPILWRKKIRTVDTLLLTHPDSDHLNGLLFIAEHFHVRTVWTSGADKDTAGYREFMEIIRRQSIERPDFESLPRQVALGALDLEILYPPKDFFDQEKAAAWRRESNNASLVTMLRFGEVAFLFPGDIEAEAELELVRLQEQTLDCTVLIAPHHGCRSSNSPVFVEHAAPEIVITSSGWKNRFHCPHPSVLARYAERGCRIFGTDRHGAVEVRTDGRVVQVMTASGTWFQDNFVENN
ncbi:MAG: DNA internalization-related competence protein ComEC/Rec2 [Thermodesulfobacteriota bacterium]